MPSLRPLLPLFAVASLAALAGCESPQQMATQKDDHLAAAGFIERPANTPERQAMLQRLPAHHFVRNVHGDTVHYVYADPVACDCLYVGDQQAYARYQQWHQQQQLANEQQMTAEDYQDAQWNWGAWGPWGPGFGGGFGYGPGW